MHNPAGRKIAKSPRCGVGAPPSDFAGGEPCLCSTQRLMPRPFSEARGARRRKLFYIRGKWPISIVKNRPHGENGPFPGHSGAPLCSLPQWGSKTLLGYTGMSGKLDTNDCCADFGRLLQPFLTIRDPEQAQISAKFKGCAITYAK